MEFRCARHTQKIESLIYFYTSVLNFEILGKFKNHNGYDGVFLGLPNQDWHLEFTYSNHKANHHSDIDDLIVFYLDSEEEIKTIIDRAQQADILPITSQNPYWNVNGIELTDLDGFGVILTISPLK